MFERSPLRLICCILPCRLLGMWCDSQEHQSSTYNSKGRHVHASPLQKEQVSTLLGNTRAPNQGSWPVTLICHYYSLGQSSGYR